MKILRTCLLFHQDESSHYLLRFLQTLTLERENVYLWSNTLHDWSNTRLWIFWRFFGISMNGIISSPYPEEHFQFRQAPGLLGSGHHSQMFLGSHPGPLRSYRPLISWTPNTWNSLFLRHQKDNLFALAYRYLSPAPPAVLVSKLSAWCQKKSWINARNVFHTHILLNHSV